MKIRHLLPLLAVVCLSIQSLAQLDPRERYGTFLGGSQADCLNLNSFGDCATSGHNFSPASTSVTAVAVDGSGNVFVAGPTNAIDFPTTTGAYRRTARYIDDGFGGSFSDDTFLTKFNANGQVVWSTYLGVTADGAPVKTIAFDSSGNVIVVGTVRQGTSRFANGAFAPFILKLNSTGSALVYYNEVYDGTHNDCGVFNLAGGMEVGGADGAVVDSSGHVYVVGESDPQNGGGCLTPTPGANQTGTGYIIKVDTAQSANHGIVYIARTQDRPRAVTLDFSGNSFITGGDNSTAGQGTYVTKFNSLGAVLFSVNYMGSFAVGSGNAITTTTFGDIIFTGTVSVEGAFPATTSFGNAQSGGDVFIARLNSTGGLVYSAVIHDPNMVPDALSRDSANEAFVTGRISASSFRVRPYSNAPLSGAFLVRLNSTSTKILLDSTFGGDTGFGITVDRAWNAFVVGFSKSGEFFPLTANAFQSSFKGAVTQGFLAKLIIEADLSLSASASPNPVAHGSNLTYTYSVFNKGPDDSDGATLTTTLPSGTTFVGFSNTNGTCTHPAVGSTGTFQCKRSSLLLAGHSWGPITLTVHVNALAGTTLTDTAHVSAKTQDVNTSNNTATVTVKVQ